MMYLYGFLSIGAVSLVSLAGALTLALRAETLQKYISFFIALAIGALLGDAFIHILPEAYDNTNAEYTGIWIIVGILVFFILEKFMHWHHHNDDTAENHVHPVGKLVLLSDGIHNLIDGIVVGASFMISTPVGFATTIAVLLHEIPQEIGDFAVLIHAGYSKKRALWLNFLSALLAFLGLVVAFILGKGSGGIIDTVLPIAAGGFIYIAIGDLIPELQKAKGKNLFWEILMIALGIIAMLTLKLFE